MFYWSARLPGTFDIAVCAMFTYDSWCSMCTACKELPTTPEPPGGSTRAVPLAPAASTTGGFKESRSSFGPQLLVVKTLLGSRATEAF